MQYPKVNFVYAYPLDNDRRKLFESKELEYPSVEDVKNEVPKVQKIWNDINYQNKVFKIFSETLKISSDRIFDFYLYGEGLNPMSAPLMMPLYSKSKKIEDIYLIEIIIHELLHKFISSSDCDTKGYYDYIDEKFQNETSTTKSHFIIFALLDKILPLIFKPNDVEQCFNRYSDIPNPGYKIAIHIVKDTGSDFFIEKFKQYTKYP